MLLFDGVFLLRSELRGFWDFTVFVQAGFDVAGQRLYLDSVRSVGRPDVVVENDDPARPRLRLRGGRPERAP